MRDIKFRVFDNGIMHYEDLGAYVSIDNMSIHACDCELMQYTGLKDKKGAGNEVYEGDIFECIFSNIPNGFKSFINSKENQIKEMAVVIYKMGMFQIRVFHPDHNEYVSYPLYDFLQNKEKVVIGNIHENPELLEVK